MSKPRQLFSSKLTLLSSSKRIGRIGQLRNSAPLSKQNNLISHRQSIHSKWTAATGIFHPIIDNRHYSTMIDLDRMGQIIAGLDKERQSKNIQKLNQWLEENRSEEENNFLKLPHYHAANFNTYHYIYKLIHHLLMQKKVNFSLLKLTQEATSYRLLSLKLAAMLGDDLTIINNYFQNFAKNDIFINASTYLKQLTDEHKCINQFPRNIKFWQKIVSDNLNDSRITRIYGQANEIEKYVEKNREHLENEIKENINKQLENKFSNEYLETCKLVKTFSLNAFIQHYLEKNRTKIAKEIHEMYHKRLLAHLNIHPGPLSNQQKDQIHQFKLNSDADKLKYNTEDFVNNKYREEAKEKYQQQQITATTSQQNYVAAQLRDNEGKIKSYCNNAYRHILSAHTDIDTLLKYTAKVVYKRSDENPLAALEFFKNNCSDEIFNSYLSLKPNDDLTKIPAIEIDGSTINADDYRLQRLSSFDPRAALLGMYTGCCQHLGHPIGYKCTIEGIESPFSGFYVVLEKKSNKIVAQCWAWRAKAKSMARSNLILDSIEIAPEYRNKPKEMLIIKFFATLADKLVTEHNVPKVLSSESSMPDHIGVAESSNTSQTLASGYKGYRDSVSVVKTLSRPGLSSDVAFFQYYVKNNKPDEYIKILPKVLALVPDQGKYIIREAIITAIQNEHVSTLQVLFDNHLLSINDSLLDEFLVRALGFRHHNKLCGRTTTHLDTIQFLLDFGQKICQQKFTPPSALFYALNYQDTEAVRRFIDSGVDITDLRQNKLDVFSHALLGGNYNIIKLAFDNMNINVLNYKNYFYKAFFSAIKRNNMPLLEWLVKYGNLNVNTKDIDGRSAIEMLLCRNPSIEDERITFLIEHGAYDTPNNHLTYFLEEHIHRSPFHIGLRVQALLTRLENNKLTLPSSEMQYCPH